MSKQLIICPHCEEVGRKNILAEIDGNVISVLRRTHTTEIIAQECIVRCGTCKKVVYYKRKKHEQSSIN